MRRRQCTWGVAAGLAVLVIPRPGTAQDGAAAATTTAAQSPTPRSPRASWFVNRQQLRVGDIVTVVVDERVTARERASKIASSNRRSDMAISANSPDFDLPLTSGLLSSSNSAETRNLGEADRRGDLSSIFTVLVTGIEPTGMLKLEGDRRVEIDGRAQDMKLEGLIRPEDVSADNIVFSSRIANATITYKGKKMSPSRGLLSRILSIFWP